MANVTYLTGATNQIYSASAFGYIHNMTEDINKTATTLHISAGAIAGAMAEENDAYWEKLGTNRASDAYAKYDMSRPMGAALVGLAEVGADTLEQLIQEYVASSTPRSHEEWLALYAEAKDFKGNPGSLDKLNNPCLIDAGPGNIRISVAIRLVQDYADKFPALNLQKYKNDYASLVNDLTEENNPNPLTAELYGLCLMEAEKWFKANGAYGNQWDNLPQEFRDALLITFVNLGEDTCAAAKAKLPANVPYEPQPGLTEAAGMNHLLNAAAIGEAIGLSGYGNDVSAVTSMVDLAKQDSAAGLAARYALLRLHYVAIEGIDYLIFARNEVTKQSINITNFIYGFATLAMRTNIIS